MVGIKQIRRDNLRALAEKHPTLAAFAERMDMSPAHVSQLINGHRNMGDAVARKLEKKAGLPEGYMDVTHTGVADESGTYVATLPGDRQRMLDLMDQMNDKERQTILNMALQIIDLGTPDPLAAQAKAFKPPSDTAAAMAAQLAENEEVRQAILEAQEDLAGEDIDEAEVQQAVQEALEAIAEEEAEDSTRKAG